MNSDQWVIARFRDVRCRGLIFLDNNSSSCFRFFSFCGGKVRQLFITSYDFLSRLLPLKITFISARGSLTTAGNRNSTQEKVASCTFSDGREISHQGKEALMFCGKSKYLNLSSGPFYVETDLSRIPPGVKK